MAKVLTLGFLLFILVAFSALEMRAQTTEFPFQGVLKDGANPANGTYDLEFALFDQAAAGSQKGPTVSRNSVVVSNGNFAVSLDFGDQFPGADRFLEVRVRPAGGGGFTTLSPRSKMNASPYAIRTISAANSDNAAKLGGLLPGQYVQTTDPRLSDSRDPLAGSSFYIRNSVAGQTASMNITGTAAVSGTNAGAVVSVTNSQAGISNPSPANLPPTAIKGEATSTSNSNAGVMGIGDGSDGIGVIGVTNGSGSGGQADAIGILALATSTTGTTTGVSAQIMSPNGAAISARTSATGLIFEGESDNQTVQNPKVTINAIGQIVTQSGVWAKGFHLNSTSADLLENGDFNTFGSITLNGGSITTNGAVTAGTLTIQNLGGSPGVSSLCATGANLVKLCSSSERYKTNIRPFGSGLDLIRKLRPVSFNWRDGGMADMGLVAEEVRAAEPLLTTTNASGQIEGVKYDRIGVVAINAIKEQQAQIEAQQRKIEQQQAEIDALKKLVCSRRKRATVCR